MQIYSKSMKNATSPLFRNHNRSALEAGTYFTHRVIYYPLVLPCSASHLPPIIILFVCFILFFCFCFLLFGLFFVVGPLACQRAWSMSLVISKPLPYLHVPVYEKLKLFPFLKHHPWKMTEFASGYNYFIYTEMRNLCAKQFVLPKKKMWDM